MKNLTYEIMETYDVRKSTAEEILKVVESISKIAKSEYERGKFDAKMEEIDKKIHKNRTNNGG